MAHPSGIGVTVMTHEGTARTDAFDERRVGLDHLALRVADRDELQRWVTHLATKGVEHSGIIDIGFGPTAVFRDPDHMQLEFYVHQSAAQLPQLIEADPPRRNTSWLARRERPQNASRTRCVGVQTWSLAGSYFLALRRVTISRKSSVWNDWSSAALA